MRNLHKHSLIVTSSPSLSIKEQPAPDVSVLPASFQCRRSRRLNAGTERGALPRYLARGPALNERGNRAGLLESPPSPAVAASQASSERPVLGPRVDDDGDCCHYNIPATRGNWP
ncbi:hypothetical protein HPB50_019257 [Hyalomma asiaticum]|uniref:Uncharacterized protein n=1 Tax=Hyalomma asiaticum TaxID=266040 RepID=A0ACB7T5Y6_HYAAI|nr:hypothetical protein HPB50_019257 [Hyalomma asiaticum]